MVNRLGFDESPLNLRFSASPVLSANPGPREWIVS
jgi:hypothetical protein